jgi:hypothetical protein
MNHSSLLELGPGDSLFTAMIAKCFNFEKIWLVDSGDFANIDLYTYHSFYNFLKKLGYDPPFDSQFDTIDSLLKNCSCNYLTEGVHSLELIPSSSIDYCFSAS